MGGYIGTKVGSLAVTAANVSGDATIGGNLTVKGTTVTVDSATAQTVDLGDNDKIQLGDGDDLQIYHDGLHSYIDDQGTGRIYIRASDQLRLQASDGENYALFAANGAAQFYYDNALKLATTATGVNVTGNITSDSQGMFDNVKVTNNAGATFWNITRGDSTGNLLFEDDGLGTAASITQSGKFGIGDTSPDRHLHVNGGTENVVAKFESTDTACSVEFTDSTGTVTLETRNDFRFKTGSNIDMILDSSGNLGVATSSNVSQTSSEEGLWYQRNDWFAVSRSGGTVAYFNRLSNAGTILEFRKDGVGVGGIINESASTITLSSNGTGYLGVSGTREYAWDTAQFYPVNDNANDLGFSSFRWDDVRATNGTIQTSDENDKEQIALLTDAEITAAKAISKLFKTFKWRDKVEAKGDNARTHTGVVAQQVQTAMSDAGLDVTKYAFWCSDTWWTKNVEVAAVEAVNEVVDEDGNVTTEAVEAKDAYIRTDTYHKQEEAPEGSVQKTRLGIRYPELLSFIGAATEQRLTSIEARLTALEG